MALLVALLIVALQAPPDMLPAAATLKLRESLKAASPHQKHLWRDTAPFDGALLNAIVEIPRGERRKLEFDMASLPRWLHQYHGHYCNYTLHVPPRGARP